MQNRVSVIIPTYKRPDRLERCLKSVLGQDYKNFEMIVVDDDPVGNDSSKVIHELRDSRIILLKNQRSKGANGARNTGIVNSKGEYLAFLDDDDEWMPNYLSSQIHRIEKTDPNTAVVYGGYLIQKNGKWIENIQNKEGNLFLDLLLDQFYIGASSNIFIRKQVVSDIGLWDEGLQRQQDLEFLLRVFKKYNVAFNNKIVSKIYGHNDPEPLKSFEAREKYFNTITPEIETIAKKNKRIFLSNHYRRQSMYLAEMKNFKQAFKYWEKGFCQKRVSIKKDVKIILAVIKSYT